MIFMDFLSFKSCKANPDIWIQEGIKSDGAKYWEYVLLYTNDYLYVRNDSKRVLRNKIGKYFILKDLSNGPPGKFLRGKVRKVHLDNGV